MAWYSYFLMSVPEVFIMTLFTFVFFGVPIKANRRKMLIDACIRGGVAFLATLYLDNSFKTLITILASIIILTMIYRFKWKYSLLLTFFPVVVIALIETINVFFIYPIFHLDIETILTDPLSRIFSSYLLLSMLLLLIFVVYKWKIRWNLADNMFR